MLVARMPIDLPVEHYKFGTGPIQVEVTLGPRAAVCPDRPHDSTPVGGGAPDGKPLPCGGAGKTWRCRQWRLALGRVVGV